MGKTLPLITLLICFNSLSLKAADALVVRHITNVEYLSPGKITLSVFEKVTILNEKGLDFSDFIVQYGPDSPIKKMVAYLYDSSGKLIKTFKNKELKDESIYAESTLFHDYRQKQAQVFFPSYPYTAVLEYTQEYNSFISIPGWQPQNGYGIGVEYASYTITYNQASPIKYKQNNLEEPVISSPREGVTELFWEVSNLSSLKYEQFSDGLTERAPSLTIVPECFTYKGSSGCYTNWASYGTWVSTLLKDQDQLPETVAAKIDQLTKDKESKYQKIEAIYKFMQDNTRYVSVQLGIGGFKPASAQEVQKNGWGDCKALVNYTKAMLSHSGIESFYCEIGVGNSGIIYDSFPSPGQTNHIILAVPIVQDTLWLECTNQHLPFATLPYSLQNQKVLWVDQQNSTGKIVRTPSLPAEYNKRSRSISLELDSSGNAKGKMKTEVTGGELEWLFPELWLSEREREEIINRKYNLAGFRLVSANYSVIQRDSLLYKHLHDPVATEQIEFTVENLASKTGNRLFIKSNPLTPIEGAFPPSNSRTANVISYHAFCYSDTLHYHIPNGYTIEYLPKPVTLNTQFGNLDAKFTYQKNTITYTRTLTINHFNESPQYYNLFANLLTTTYRTDTDYIILTQKKL